MAKSSKLRVMISSRCNDPFPLGNKASTPLSSIRKELKAEIEQVEVLGKKVFDVWINEDAPPASGKDDIWEHCLKQVKQCDILLVLSNGSAGWAKTGVDIGICHAELMTGLSLSPGKVQLISLGNVSTGSSEEKKRNKLFLKYIEEQGLFCGHEAKSVDELKSLVKDALHEAVITLVQHGVREVSKGKFHSGQALGWSRMDFSERQKAMRKALCDALKDRPGAVAISDHIAFPLAERETLFVGHAVPAALSIASAKEMVGQPFLRDHEMASELQKRGGPVHIIACHKTATESQATRLLGFPDATIVSAPFGIYVADNIQKVQFAFIVNCRDETNTRHGVQRFLEWLEQTGEAKLMARRAQSRAMIVKKIAAARDF